MVTEENEFERRVRQGEARALRQVPAGKRRVTERWWWFGGITASFWLTLAEWPFARAHTRAENVFAILGLIVVVAGTPSFVWLRRHEERKRAGARGRTPPGSAETV